MENAFVVAKKLKSNNITPADLPHHTKRLTRDQVFIIAYCYYLLGILTENTKTHYKSVIDQFIRYMSNTRQVTPLDAIGLDINLWRDDLLRTGGVAGAPPNTPTHRYAPQAKSSVENKTAVLSAFYKFLQKPGLDGSDPLVRTNPVTSLHTRFKIEKYGNSKKIDKQTLSKILDQLSLDTVKGLRDYALVYGYFITGRRKSEWVSLTWGQLNFNRTPPTYTFIRKGQKQTTDEIPEQLQKVMFRYLRCRWGEEFYKKMHKDLYLFTALPGKGGARQIIDPNHPLSERSVLRILKKLAKKAGIPPEQITVHSLRHLHAETYLEAGANVEEVRARLCHESLATTQRYISSMKNEQNRLAGRLDDLLKNSRQDNSKIKNIIKEIS